MASRGLVPLRLNHSLQRVARHRDGGEENQTPPPLHSGVPDVNEKDVSALGLAARAPAELHSDEKGSRI